MAINDLAAALIFSPFSMNFRDNFPFYDNAAQVISYSEKWFELLILKVFNLRRVSRKSLKVVEYKHLFYVILTTLPLPRGFINFYHLCYPFVIYATGKPWNFSFAIGAKTQVFIYVNLHSSTIHVLLYRCFNCRTWLISAESFHEFYWCVLLYEM